MLAFLTGPPVEGEGLSSHTKIEMGAYLVDLPAGHAEHIATFEAMPTIGFDTMSLSDGGALPWVNNWAAESAEELERLHQELLEREMAPEADDVDESEEADGDGLGFESWQRLLVISPDGEVTDVGDRVRTVAARGSTGDLIYLDVAGNLKRWSVGTGAAELGPRLESPMYDTGTMSRDGRLLAITNGWSNGPEDPLRISVYDVESDTFDATYEFGGINAWGSMWWWSGD